MNPFADRRNLRQFGVPCAHPSTVRVRSLVEAKRKQGARILRKTIEGDTVSCMLSNISNSNRSYHGVSRKVTAAAFRCGNRVVVGRKQVSSWRCEEVSEGDLSEEEEKHDSDYANEEERSIEKLKPENEEEPSIEKLKPENEEEPSIEKLKPENKEEQSIEILKPALRDLENSDDSEYSEDENLSEWDYNDG
eukprot:g3879.t1